MELATQASSSHRLRPMPFRPRTSAAAAAVLKENVAASRIPSKRVGAQCFRLLIPAPALGPFQEFFSRTALPGGGPVDDDGDGGGVHVSRLLDEPETNYAGVCTGSGSLLGAFWLLPLPSRSCNAAM